LIGVKDGDSSGNSMSWRPRRWACSSRRLRPCPQKASVWNGNQLLQNRKRELLLVIFY